MGDMLMFNSLVAALKTKREDDQIRAAHALADLGDPRAFEPLVLLLETTSNANVRDAAAFGLGALGDSRAIPMLRNQIWQLEYAHNRGTIVGALDQLKVTQAVVDFARLICEAVYEPAYRALHAIEEFEQSPNREDLAQALTFIEQRRGEPMDNEWRAELLEDAEEQLHHWIGLAGFR